MCGRPIALGSRVALWMRSPVERTRPGEHTYVSTADRADPEPCAPLNRGFDTRLGDVEVTEGSCSAGKKTMCGSSDRYGSDPVQVQSTRGTGLNMTIKQLRGFVTLSKN